MSTEKREITTIIREYRKKAGWTQDQLASKIGTSKQNIGYYETGKRTPKIEMKLKIAEALKIPLADLIDTEGATIRFGQNDTEHPLDGEFLTKPEELARECKKLTEEEATSLLPIVTYLNELKK